jgi:hypothetical protein
MANEKIEFTRTTLSAVTSPATGRAYVRDSVQPGLWEVGNA